MRRSKVETAETRRRIVATAAREFRSNGIHATGLAELMANAGLTHGGFYRHFDSKGQLVAEACAAAMEAVVDAAEVQAREAGRSGGFKAIVSSYLSPRHRDDRSEGCPLPGLGSELARADDPARAAATAGFLKLVDVVAKQFTRMTPDAARARAVFTISAMVGALTMSRIVSDPALSDAILSEAERALG